MKNFNLQNLMKQIKNHINIFLRGIARTLYGAFITGLVAVAIYGFVLIKGENGYAAVFDFVASCGLLVLALCNAYILGCKRKGGKK